MKNAMFLFFRQCFRTARQSWRHTNRLDKAWMRCTMWCGSSTRRKSAFARSSISDLQDRLNQHSTPGVFGFWLNSNWIWLPCVLGAGAWTGAAGGDEAGDGGGHETAGEGYAWETGHAGSPTAPAWPSQDSQCADVPQSSGINRWAWL